jgi:hypothetical protein
MTPGALKAWRDREGGDGLDANDDVREHCLVG